MTVSLRHDAEQHHRTAAFGEPDRLGDGVADAGAFEHHVGAIGQDGVNRSIGIGTAGIDRVLRAELERQRPLRRLPGWRGR